MKIPLILADFRALFPIFSEKCTFAADTVVEMNFDTAGLYMSSCWPSNSQGMTLKQQTYALYLMTAHLISLTQLAAKQQAGNIESASIDKVSITVKLPELKNQWEWWMNQTPFGQNLWALLQTISTGGFYIGGRPELAAFRRSSFR